MEAVQKQRLSGPPQFGPLLPVRLHFSDGIETQPRQVMAEGFRANIFSGRRSEWAREVWPACSGLMDLEQ
ncbi:hypothetical protein EGR_09114 [Echinococcus granulosus]|uniref:Uncharacterized protein n=1 Tax=Echinococcus granulosus TaxID=6210 RepID=W6URM5_ECHGR|nr:hypothetical protein EGR_09114 [Echinococcus granulosus]EUB56034.1 hypothetical protein EGR_09114 [Echinococcus granulosus]